MCYRLSEPITRQMPAARSSSYPTGYSRFLQPAVFPAAAIGTSTALAAPFWPFGIYICRPPRVAARAESTRDDGENFTPALPASGTDLVGPNRSGSGDASPTRRLRAAHGDLGGSSPPACHGSWRQADRGKRAKTNDLVPRRSPTPPMMTAVILMRSSAGFPRHKIKNGDA
jgi:hypothetical protein